MRTFTLVAALTVAFPAWASFDRLPITQDSPTDFTVGYKAGAGLNNFWCAAGRYVTSKLGLPASTRLFRMSPPPRKAGKGVAFTLDPAKSAGDTGVTTFGGPQDGSFSAGGAQSDFCNARRSIGQ